MPEPQEETALVPASGGNGEAWAALKKLVTDAVTSPHSKRAYGQALDAFGRWCSATGVRRFDKAVVQAYRTALEESGLAASSINVALAAIRRLALEATDNGWLAAETAAAIGRVKGAKRHGVRAGNWLTREQAEKLLAMPDRKKVKGRRDLALLALLVGCGLRREELAGLNIEDIQQRDGRWCIVDLTGKGRRVRTVPMPSWAKGAIDEWLAVSGFAAGPLLGAVNKGGRIERQGMSAEGVYGVVDGYGKKLGLTLAPHDVLRTFAKLAHKGRAPLEQIQISLGHASIATTERYLGIAQDLTDAPCDHLGIRIKS